MSKYFNGKQKYFYWLKKHPNLHYMIHCLRRFGDKDYYRFIFNEGYPGLIRIENNGGLYPQKDIFLLNIEGDKIGLPCYIRYALHALYELGNLNFSVVIKFNDRSMWLQESVKVNGTDNIYEYFFEQPTEVKLAEIGKCYHVYSSNCVSLLTRASMDLGIYKDNGLLAAYEVSEDYISLMGDLYKRNIRFNSYTEKYLEEQLNRIFSNRNHAEKIVGLHLRGTDFGRNYKDHPKAVGIDQYTNMIDKAIKKHGFTKVFIATDDINMLKMVQDRYGEIITFYKDTFRSSGSKNILSIESDGASPKYKKGLEVLRDIYTLSKCDGLIAGLSHVSILARIMKKSSDKEYEFQRIISNGIN